MAQYSTRRFLNSTRSAPVGDDVELTPGDAVFVETSDDVDAMTTMVSPMLDDSNISIKGGVISDFEPDNLTCPTNTTWQVKTFHSYCLIKSV